MTHTVTDEQDLPSLMPYVTRREWTDPVSGETITQESPLVRRFVRQSIDHTRLVDGMTGDGFLRADGAPWKECGYKYEFTASNPVPRVVPATIRYRFAP